MKEVMIVVGAGQISMAIARRMGAGKKQRCEQGTHRYLQHSDGSERAGRDQHLGPHVHLEQVSFFKQRTAFPTGTPFFAFITPCAFPQSRQPFCPAAAQRSRHPSSPCGWCGAAGAGSGWRPSRPRHPVPPPRPCQAASRKNWWIHVS